MMQMEMRPCLDEFEKLFDRINSPRVIINNTGCETATLVMINSARKDGILLEAVQVLTDLNLLIKKGYVSLDGRWNMDVFYVTSLDGNKLTDDSIINCIQQSLENIPHTQSKFIEGMTAIELTGTDRVGHLSEVFVVLSDLKCDVVESKVWTHNGRIALLTCLKDCESGCPINNSHKIESIAAHLRNALKGDNNIRSAKTSVSMTHTERRLHQMMFADRDFERTYIKTSGECSLPFVRENGIKS